MNKKWLAFVIWLAITTAFSLASLQRPAAQAHGHDDLADAVLETLRTHSAYSGIPFTITSSHIQGDWALVAVGALDGPTVVRGYIGTQNSGLLLLASRQNSGWQVGIEGDPIFARLLAQAPMTLLSPQAKALLKPNQHASPAGANAVQTVSYKWPWPAGLAWRWLQGWHGRALDIGTEGGDRRVLASAAGVVTYVCKGNLGAALKVRDADGVALEYWHIDSARLSGAVQLGATVEQGQWLGTLRPGTWTDNSACGGQFTSQTPNSTHVHWVLPTDRTFTVEGWSITFPNSVLTNGNQTRPCNDGCWGSAFFFTSSNRPNDEPSPAISTSTHTATPTPMPTSTSTPTPMPTTTSTPIMAAALSIEPTILITQTGTLITLSVMLNNASLAEVAAVAFDLSYSATLVSLELISSTDVITPTTPTVVSDTLGTAAFAGAFITTPRQHAPVPIAQLRLRTQAAGLSAVGITSATLVSSSGEPLELARGDGVILAVAEWPAARMYVPLVMRDAASKVGPAATPTLAATPTDSSSTTSTTTSTPLSEPTPTSTTVEEQ